MSRISNTTNRQSKFLRLLSRDPLGLPTDQWPSVPLLRKWMRRPGFVAALESIRRTLLTQSDLHLAAATAQIAHWMRLTPLGSQQAEDAPSLHTLLQVFRLAHARAKQAPLTSLLTGPAGQPLKTPQPSEHARRLLHTILTGQAPPE